MPVIEDAFVKSQDEILGEFLTGLQAAVPDAYLGEDGIIRIIFTIEAGQLENAFLANQLLLEDIFIQTAGYEALQMHGETYDFPMRVALQAQGQLTFSGDGGTFIPVGTEVGYDPGGGLEVVYFETITEDTIPSPGVPTAPTVAVGAAGNLTGTFEYVVTYVTAAGESLPSAVSSAVVTSAQQINLTNIPIGGTGTTMRRIYRRKDGTGDWRRATEIANNTATTYTDNTADISAQPLAPTTDTARQITVDAQAQEGGINGNVAINTVTELTNTPTTLTAVTNPVAFTGGTDDEDTEDYRLRLLDHIRNPATGSAGDYKSWAEEIAGVESATVFENMNFDTAQNGHVTVRISGPGGSVPSADTVAAVQAALQEQGIANIVIHVGTFTGQPTNVTVDVTLETDYTLVDVTPSVQTAITNYINALGVGETLYISGIIDAVFGLPGILDVVMTTPTSNQTTAAGTKRTPGTIAVT